jgi:hypothetical protein
MRTCVNHPIKEATAQCKACHKPLCDECKKITDTGIFCSDDCYERFKDFSKRAEALPMPKRNPFARLLNFLKKLAILIVILLIGYGLVNVIYGSPEGFFGSIKKLFNIIF